MPAAPRPGATARARSSSPSTPSTSWLPPWARPPPFRETCAARGKRLPTVRWTVRRAWSTISRAPTDHTDMPETRWRRMFEVFADALERSADEREAFLLAACGSDEELRREIDELLAQHAAGSGVLDRAAVGTGPVGPIDAADAPADAMEGTHIGPYRLGRRLGEGGMGVVYEAEQTGALSRRVALKLVKPGMDTRELIARFSAERQT